MEQSVIDFCRQVRVRSAEHQVALAILLEKDLFGVAVALLRLEIDSLIRVAFLCEQGASSQVSRLLMENTVNGEQWAILTADNRYSRITDREMVNLASKDCLWVNIIYSFGCKLIHLSNLHDYKVSDPLVKIADEKRLEIIKYLRQHHKYPDDEIDLPRLKAYLPKVMQKLVENVAYYVDKIESMNTL
ncbi:hypothetical protein [Anabaena azotica]|uniref:Uncharacterized protein n=1 Tax=Anabaena azotica FACHB-119 TaxID=947527 RepID=A0ABR8DDM0_9NOST|nr:hypothetical protein [Anabaena azotica]MBD2505066.1 hypothetical protein [Anabaena azotica FACHB-119]